MRCFDRQGAPISIDEWSRLNRDFDYRVVIQDGEVSTVWLGLDHQYGDGPPLIFESLTYDAAGNEVMWRYSTEEQAREGHQRLLDLRGLVVPIEVRP